MSTNIKAVALMLAAALCAPVVMAQNSPSTPTGGGTQTEQTPSTTTPTKHQVKKGKKKVKKGEKMEKKGEKEEKKGEEKEKKGMQEEKGTTNPSTTPSTTPSGGTNP